MSNKPNTSPDRGGTAPAAAEVIPSKQTAVYQLNCEINGRTVAMATEPSKRLLHILRDDLKLTGTKRSCEIGRCGACMVLIDGRPVNSCLTMAYQVEGARITTIEGLNDERSERIKDAFLEEGGFQCGYCTPGMVVSTKALLDEHPSPDRAQIEEALCGNICRCTGYGGIVRAVCRAAEQEDKESGQ